MKKVLYASTALMLMAGAAAADVTVSGSGRFGLVHDSSVAPGLSETTLSYRLRFNVDASKETDSGVKFGGRIRFQDSTNGEAIFSGAYVYAEASGFRLEVGNANTAYDSGALIYNSEIGFTDSSVGDPIFDFYSFASSGYAFTSPGRVGVYASYAFEGGTVRASYVNPDQTLSTLPVGQEAEWGVSADYKFGAVTVAAGYVTNEGGVDGKTQYNLAGEYAVNDTTNVGLIYFNYDSGAGPAFVNNSRITLYGNTALANGVTVAGYISNDDLATNVNDTGIGIGASYDLGGATLAGAIHRTFADETFADLGVKFSF